jgi:hypothetical protein
MINKEISDCICSVQCGDMYGTAFLVSDRIAVTAYHTISNHETKEIKLNFTTTNDTCLATYITAEVQYKEMDIALLQLKDPQPRTTYLRFGVRSLKENERWYSRGYPSAKLNTGENLQSENNVINQILPTLHNRKIDIELDLDRKFASYSGLSGAPLIISGLVVGLINMQLEQEGHARELNALSAKHFSDLLTSNGIFIHQEKKMNSLLIRTLMTAIARYNQRAKDILRSAEQREKNWEDFPRFSDAAKQHIHKNLFGALSIRKLIAIGIEANSKPSNQNYHYYVDLCVGIAKKILSLLNFALISKLWDHIENKPVVLNDAQREALTNFFECAFELNIKERHNLLIELITAFAENKLDFPIPELENFTSLSKEQIDLTKQIEKLHELENTDHVSSTFEQCFVGEEYLCNLLWSFSFIARYEMVSLKGITFEAIHKAEKHYIHNYYPLVPKDSAAIQEDIRACHTTSIATDSVIMFDQHYENGIYLFPFVIDLNALRFENQSKVYFYESQGSLVNELNYKPLEDSKLHTISRSGGHDFSNMDEIVSNIEMHKQYKLNAVFSQFQKAKTAILGQV